MVERILVVAPHLGALTDCARTLDDLTARRCHVHIAVHGEPPPGANLTSLTGKFHRLTTGPAPPLDRWAALGILARGWLDCWRYLEAPTRDDRAYQQALDEAPPQVASWASRRWLQMPGVFGLVTSSLRAIERRLPASPRVVEFLRAQRPDVLIVVPVFGVGSTAPAFLQAAAELAIPTLAWPSHWDDIARGAILHRVPDCLVLWNRDQRQQIVERRAVSPRRTIILGASLPLDIVPEPEALDSSVPGASSSSAVRAKEQLGLDPRRAVILYAPAASADRVGVTRWIGSVRASQHPSVRDAQLVVHLEPPGRVQQSADQPAADVRVVPRAGSDPSAYAADIAEALACADVVVASDTTLLFEALARGIPVVALSGPDESSQALTRIAADTRGVPGLIAAANLTDHIAALETLLSTPLTSEQRGALRAVVRPHGPSLRPGFLLAVRALQEVIDRRAERPPSSSASSWDRLLLSPFASLAERRAHALIGRHRPSRLARVLVAVASGKSLFLYQPLVRLLAERGHDVSIVFTARAEFPVDLYQKVKCDVPGVTVAGVLPQRTDSWAGYSRALLGVFSLGVLKKRYATATPAPAWLTRYARTAVPGRFHRLVPLLLRVPLAARVSVRVARRLARLIPPSEDARALLLQENPDTVIVLPDDDASVALDSASPQLDVIAAAASRQTPVLAAVGASELGLHPIALASPRYLCVWNDEQRRTAVSAGARENRVNVTGPLLVDRCLHDPPLFEPQAFRELLGLPSESPFVLVAGSNGLLNEPGEEVEWIRQWLKSLRASADPALRDVAVLIRPSLLGSSRWRGLDVEGDSRVVIGPRAFERSGELDAVLLAESVRFSALTVTADPLTLLIAAGLGRPAAVVIPPRFAAEATATPLTDLWNIEGSRVRQTPTLTELSAYLREVLDEPQPSSSAPSHRADRHAASAAVATMAMVECVERAVAESRGRAVRPT